MSPVLLPLGDEAATLRFGEAIDLALNARAHAFCAALESARPAGLREWAPAFSSVTLWYDPDALSFDELNALCLRLASTPNFSRAGVVHELPFCAEEEFAPDLFDVAARNGMTPRDWLDAFSKVNFDVYMLGFLPGFAYLGGLPNFLDAPRLATPRKIVPERSVAIADGMCAAYPFASPGGWRLVGRTPLQMFDAGAKTPTRLAPGDRVRWRPIALDEFLELEAQWRG
ncbi:5-oxoprolinase subunit PxpB [Rhodoblastus acidophilus]|uniref:5-oxoprolinase subunit PxpB n=1 Tax=Rhodoblastus acidophilus TaxID=1074 RepID=A0A6N8DPW2_RHOAC|nr:5-oxoprolinase subunit PxpB [Rhodoblastus acidophilus]MCW2274325.1 KipI family sensor histidine kinase inhibitor [Rhodoblastus acidophilus]MTV31221.1 5-oxoprolinase subunit PxpB [Rhodoblastus acidophilus]